MPVDLILPSPLPGEGWKVKICEKERLEPPHVTISRKTERWRVGLRDGSFLEPPGGSWKEIDPRVKAEIESRWQWLVEEWDKKYPANPVRSDANR